MSEAYTPAGGVGTAVRRATVAEAATGTHGSEFMRDNVSAIADKIRYLKDTGLFNFPAVQVADADPNVLDDYEEGVFTPAVQFGGASAGIAYAAQVGRYTKIGRLLHASAHIVLTNKGASVGAATIAGFPFVPGAKGAGSWGYHGGMAAIATPAAWVDAGSGLLLYNGGAAASAQLTDANFTNASEFILSITYTT